MTGHDDIPKTLAGLPNSAPRYIGQPIERLEDPALLTGQTEFIDNVVLPRMLHCAILRSPHAHARIVSVDVSEAEKLPGVFAVITGEDAKRWSNPTMTVPPGWGTHCLATDKARFVGEPVAGGEARAGAVQHEIALVPRRGERRGRGPAIGADRTRGKLQPRKRIP